MKKQIFSFILVFLISKSLFSQLSKDKSFASFVSSTSISDYNLESFVNSSYSFLINQHFAFGVSGGYSYYENIHLTSKFITRDKNLGINARYFINPQDKNIFYVALDGSLGRENVTLTGHPEIKRKDIYAKFGIGLLSFFEKNEHLSLSSSISYESFYSGDEIGFDKSKAFTLRQSITPIFSQSFVDKMIDGDKSLLKAKRITFDHQLSYSFWDKASFSINPSFVNLFSRINPLFIGSKFGYFILKNLELGVGCQTYVLAGKDNNSLSLTPQITYYLPITRRFSIFPTIKNSNIFDSQQSYHFWSFGTGINYFLNKHIATQAIFFYDKFNNQKELNLGFKYFLR